MAEVSQTVQEARQRWYGHVLGRDEESVEKKGDRHGGAGAQEKRKTEDQIEGLYCGRCARETTGYLFGTQK